MFPFGRWLSNQLPISKRDSTTMSTRAPNGRRTYCAHLPRRSPGRPDKAFRAAERYCDKKFRADSLWRYSTAPRGQHFSAAVMRRVIQNRVRQGLYEMRRSLEDGRRILIRLKKTSPPNPHSSNSKKIPSPSNECGSPKSIAQKSPSPIGSQRDRFQIHSPPGGVELPKGPSSGLSRLKRATWGLSRQIADPGDDPYWHQKLPLPAPNTQPHLFWAMKQGFRISDILESAYSARRKTAIALFDGLPIRSPLAYWAGCFRREIEKHSSLGVTAMREEYQAQLREAACLIAQSPIANSAAVLNSSP